MVRASAAARTSPFSVPVDRGLSDEASRHRCYELVKALGMERSEWVKFAQDEGRQNTESEKITICVLAALEHALEKACNASNPDAVRPP